MRANPRNRLESVLKENRIKQKDIYDELYKRFEKLKAQDPDNPNIHSLTPINKSNLSFIVSGKRYGVSLMTAARIKYAINVLTGKNYTFHDLFENDRMRFNTTQLQD